MNVCLLWLGIASDVRPISENTSQCAPSAALACEDQRESLNDSRRAVRLRRLSLVEGHIEEAAGDVKQAYRRAFGLVPESDHLGVGSSFT